MPAPIMVELAPDVFAALQDRARPLVDDINSVLRRLLAESLPASAEVRYLTMARGDRLPIGLRLRARFRDGTFNAEVGEDGILFEGHTYDSPSAAARAVKLSVGVPEEAAQTNGWLFWDYWRESVGAYEPLDTLRRASEIERAPAPSSTGRRTLPRSIGIGASGRSDISRRASEPLWRYPAE